MAVLHVFDDGQKTAELVRVRAAKFVIGRTAGDLVIPQDPLLSGRHAEVVRESQEGRWCWCLHDLGSTNGSFVRAKVGVLKDGTEFLLARCRFRFVAAPEPADGSAPEESAPAPGAIYKTIGWQHMPQAPTGRGRPCLVELLPTGEGRRLPLSSDSQWIGRDPRRCALVLPDPTISPCHAKIFRDSQDRWHIEDANALNGLWIRIHERIPLTSQSSFLLGEQIFAVVLP
jgi:pSer/pThr/pTyr-binding forkhead associated (FHA) protein